jgi:acyl-CoA synthetase (NDP forming)
MYENASLFPRLFDCVLKEDVADVVAVNLRANVPKPGGWAPNREFARIMRDKLAGSTDKLVVGFSSFAGADLDQELVTALADVGVPFLEGTETSMLAIRHLVEHRRFLDRKADAPVATVRDAHSPVHARGVLGNAEAMRLLREFGIPLADTESAATADAAVAAAERIGYPVVVKVDSADIAHKSDVGGVRLGCADAASVRRAFDEMLAEVARRAPAAKVDGVLVQPMVAGGVEMIVGVKSDSVVGPAVVCGFGGVLVEVMRDVAVRVPPIDVREASAMLAELRGAALLRGVRGRPAADVAAVADVLVKIAALAEAHRERLRAVDLNPLVVGETGKGAVVVDWLIEFA